MLDRIFKNVPSVIREKLQNRLESLLLDIEESKVPDIKAIIELANQFRVKKK